MTRAINLARNGKPAPNPKVGAVIVKDNRIVGTGYHRKAGFPHAEVIAIKSAGTKTTGAILYTNLEPCCHYGQTPPCTDQIIKAGIKRVVVGIIDPNPQVSSRGIKQLKNSGIEVVVGVEEKRCRDLNRGYIKRVKTGLPYTIVKIASSLDGRIATRAGESKWITSETSRRYVHQLRSQVDAAVIGIGTVLKDNPELTVRQLIGQNPARIIIDKNLQTPENASTLSAEAPTYILTRIKKEIPKAKTIELQDYSPPAILKKIGELGFNEIMIEGGSQIFSSMIGSRLFDELIIIFAPKIIGEGIPFARFKIETLADSFKIEIIEVKRFGPDIMVRGINVHRDNN